MSTTDYRGVEIERDSTGYLDPLWDHVADYCGNDPLKWRNFAMLALRVNGWPFPWISAVFQRHQGQVLRCCRQAQREMRRYLHVEVDLGAAEHLEEEPLDEQEGLGFRIQESDLPLIRLTHQLAQQDYLGSQKEVMGLLQLLAEPRRD